MRQTPTGRYNRANVFFEPFVPRKGYYAAPLIVDANLLVFFIMVSCGLGFMSFKADDLLTWGGNFRPYTERQCWRLLSSMFLHGGFIYVLLNMIALVFVGTFLEPLLGKAWFGGLYLLTGVVAAAASIWLHATTVSVGASGAIFGMLGVFLVLLFRKLLPKPINKFLFITVGLVVLLDLVLGELTEGVDNAAHIGGLSSGLLAGFLLYPRLKKERDKQKALLGAPGDGETRPEWPGFQR